MNQVTSLVSLAGALAFVGCASQAPATSTARSPSSGNVAATTSGTPQTDTKFTSPRDFHRVVVDGQEKYCRKYWPTGTHAESQTECLTEAELKERQRISSDALREWKRGEEAVPGQITGR